MATYLQVMFCLGIGHAHMKWPASLVYPYDRGLTGEVVTSH